MEIEVPDSASDAGEASAGPRIGFSIPDRRSNRWHYRPMRRILLSLLCPFALLLASHSIASPPAERVLVLTKTAGWRHDSIPVAVRTLQRLLAEQGMQADHTEDAGRFNPDALSRYRVVVFANTTGDILTDQQQQALEAFVRAGGGFVGVHSAADTEHDWLWYGRLVGAYFKSHPRGLQATRVQPEREGKPRGAAWPIRDEIYNFHSNPRADVHVVATVDEAMYEGGTMGADHPITWCHAYDDGGRAWYTGLGHDIAVYDDANFLDQLRRGLRYAANRSDEC